MTLYQKILGEQFYELAKPLQLFHSRVDGASASGYVEFKRGRNYFAKLIGIALCLPVSSKKTLVELKVQANTEYELWIRNFGGKHAVSKQFLKDGLLFEKAGCTRVAMKVTSTDGNIYFESVQFFIGVIKFPKIFSPQINAVVKQSQTGWHFKVEISLKVIGPILSYFGEMSSL